MATAARHCEALSRAHRLAIWVGEGRPVTPKHVLRPRDVPAATRAMGFLGSSRINTAADVPALRRPWKITLAINFLRIVDGHAVAENDSWQAAQPWLIGRAALPAARKILAAAAAATPAQRIAAVEIVDALGEPAHAAWREVTTVPDLAAHARIVLTDWSQPHAPSPEDSAWLAVEYAVAALTTSGPDEALSCITERIPGQDLDSRLRASRCGNHPDTAALAEALTTFVTSGAKPTSSQVYQFKISLKRMRNPIWRRVLMPVTARLGLLHEVIQIVMNWGGDHLHAFSVGDEHYGDPFSGPDLRDEEHLRLCGAFTPSTRTITYRYDFGACWRHDITCEKVLDLDVDATYPVCVTGRGDFPLEYWTDEDDDQEPIPFDQDKINTRLAELARHSN